MSPEKWWHFEFGGILKIMVRSSLQNISLIFMFHSRLLRFDFGKQASLPKYF